MHNVLPMNLGQRSVRESVLRSKLTDGDYIYTTTREVIDL